MVRRSQAGTQSCSVHTESLQSWSFRGLAVTVGGQQIIAFLRKQQGGTSDIIHQAPSHPQSEHVVPAADRPKWEVCHLANSVTLHTIPVNIQLLAVSLSER